MKIYPKPLKIDDPSLQATITLADGYRIMQQYLKDFVGRGDMPVSDTLWAFVALAPDGQSQDPATLSDWVRAAEKVRGATGAT